MKYYYVHHEMIVQSSMDRSLQTATVYIHRT